MSNQYGNMSIVSARDGSLVFCVDAATVPSATTFTANQVMPWTPYWNIGTSSVTGFSMNGTSGENELLIGNNCFGRRSVLWQAWNNDASSDADGGWGSSHFSIDHTKLYRYTTKAIVLTTGSNGTYYNGMHGSPGGVTRWDNGTTSQTNPYFACPSHGSYIFEKTWVLGVWYAFPSGTSAGGGGSPYTSDYGYYPIKTQVRTTVGVGCNTGGNVIWQSTNTTANQREYLYYSTDPSVKMRWDTPRVDEINGSEPTIAQLCSSEQDFWYDLTGNATNMTSFNNPVITRDTNGGYFTFNGTTTRFQGRNNTAMDSPQNLTVQAWVNPQDNSQSGHIFEKGLVNTQYSIFQNGGTFTWRTMGASTQDLTFAASSVCPANTWSLVTCTYDGSNKRIYKNGTQVTSAAVTGSISTNTGGAWIGCYGNAADYFWDGKIASVKVYNRALSTTEIKNNFDSQRNRFGV